jgi:hypothetical protein
LQLHGAVSNQDETPYLDCLIWAREHGCDWSHETCTAAAYKGHLDCLIWAREHDCDWNSNTCSEAAKSNILEWMTSIGF